ncbi:uncharacterized protein [Scyliorhinus torazame]|uniref:uncharacterized protein isoform X2 n=1 Tax=Scyliorhinus torazame TaxID=75743 RepID=UPI003B59BBF3
MTSTGTSKESTSTEAVTTVFTSPTTTTAATTEYMTSSGTLKGSTSTEEVTTVFTSPTITTAASTATSPSTSTSTEPSTMVTTALSPSASTSTEYMTSTGTSKESTSTEAVTTVFTSPTTTTAATTEYMTSSGTLKGSTSTEEVTTVFTSPTITTAASTATSPSTSTSTEPSTALSPSASTSTEYMTSTGISKESTSTEAVTTVFTSPTTTTAATTEYMTSSGTLKGSTSTEEVTTVFTSPTITTAASTATSPSTSTSTEPSTMVTTALSTSASTSTEYMTSTGISKESTSTEAVTTVFTSPTTTTAATTEYMTSSGTLKGSTSTEEVTTVFTSPTITTAASTATSPSTSTSTEPSTMVTTALSTSASTSTEYVTLSRGVKGSTSTEALTTVFSSPASATATPSSSSTSEKRSTQPSSTTSASTRGTTEGSTSTVSKAAVTSSKPATTSASTAASSSFSTSERSTSSKLSTSVATSANTSASTSKTTVMQNMTTSRAATRSTLFSQQFSTLSSTIETSTIGSTNVITTHSLPTSTTSMITTAPCPEFTEQDLGNITTENVGNQSFTLKWSDKTLKSCGRYNIEKSPGDGSFLCTFNFSKNTCSFVDLSPGQTYTLNIYFIDKVNRTLTRNLNVTTVPAFVSNITFSSNGTGNTSLAFTWAAAKGYVYSYVIRLTSMFDEKQQIVVRPNQNLFAQFFHLQPGQTYTITVITETTDNLSNTGVKVQHNTDFDECSNGDNQCEQICIERNKFEDNKGYECSCQTGFKLDSDKTSCRAIESCTLSCTNAKCFLSSDQLTCECNRGYRKVDSGQVCRDVNECNSQSNKCNQICQNTLGSYKCLCQSGYLLNQGDKRSCDDVNECDSELNNCDQICQNTLGSYKCSCQRGYLLDKRDQESCHDINECSSNPCNGKGSCVNTQGSFHCECATGWTGKTCSEDVNECLTNPCMNGTCLNIRGSYQCQCYGGFTGRNCETNIDECSSQPCLHEATCRDSINNFVCDCIPGYTGRFCQNIINNCARKPCQHNGFCQNLINYYICTCQINWKGKDCNTDVDECSTDIHNCDRRAGKCNNTDGSYTCSCKDGYEGDGTICREKRLFNYGTEVSDVQLQARANDIISPVISIPTGFPFDDAFYYRLYFSDNGLIIFQRQNEYFQSVYSSPFWAFRRRYYFLPPMIAVFWDDADLTRGTGRIYYQVFDFQVRTDSHSRSFQNDLKTQVNDYYGSELDISSFTPKWALKITWENVLPFSGYRNADPDGTNTYQAVLTTDGIFSFCLIQFKDGGMNWKYYLRPDYINYALMGYSSGSISSSEDSNAFPAFNDPHTRFFVSPYKIYHPDQYPGFKTGKKGRWAYRLERNNQFTRNPRQKCFDWYLSEPRPYWHFNAPPCPCSIWQAWFDNSFTWGNNINGYGFDVKEPQAFYLTMQSRFARGSSGVRCYYSFNGGLIYGEKERFLPTPWTHYNWWFWWWRGFFYYLRQRNNFFNNVLPSLQKQYAEREVEPYHDCCRDSGHPYYCSLFRLRRPLDFCFGYRPPRTGWFFGDPHVATMDDVKYTFNGLGEFILLNVMDDNDTLTFSLQGRTLRAGENRTSQATSFVALAAQGSTGTKAQWNINDNDEIIVRVDGNIVNVTENTTFINQVTLQKTDNNETVATFEDGTSVTVSGTKGTLSFIATLDNSLKNKTEGLLGIWNDDKTDDFKAANGTYLDFDGTNLPNETQIFFDFGLTWKTTVNNSVFTYNTTPEESWYTYNNNSFVPKFYDQLLLTTAPEKIDKANETCQGNDDCIFDALSTDDLSFGAATLQSLTTFVAQNSTMNNFPPNITGKSTIQTRLNESTFFLFTATDENDDVVTFSVLTDSPDITITENGNFSWNPTSSTPVFAIVQANDSKAVSEVGLTLMLCNCSINSTCDYSRSTLSIEKNNTAFMIPACNCTPAYTGDYCTENFDACQDNQCFLNDTCKDNPAPLEGYECDPCPVNLMGDGRKCFDVDECLNETDSCEQICTNVFGGFNCSCNKGYTVNSLNSSLCIDIDECSNTSTCPKNAVCMNSVGNYSCMCKSGYEGEPYRFCLDIDECLNTNSCPGNSFCTNTESSFNCTCQSGYEKPNCTDIDECAQIPRNCPLNSVCNNADGSFTCQCNKGYEGTNCTDIDECQKFLFDCPNHAGCQNILGSFTCSCLPGYKGNETFCEDIDECTNSTGRCPSNETCENTMGNYTCNCQTGSERVNGSCQDINECQNPIYCSKNGQRCVNTELSFKCECKNGFKNVNGTCQDINECLHEELNNCSKKGLCANLEGTYDCQCMAGYSGNGTTCDDENECLDSNICSEKNNTKCVNSEGSFNCTCLEGHEGLNCTDVDECLDSNACSWKNNSICTNTRGSFTCTCQNGNEGPNCTSLPTISTSSPTSLPVPSTASIMTTAEETSKTSTTRATVPAVILSTTVSPPTTGIHTTTSTPRITSTNLSTTPITTTSVTSTPRIASTNLSTTPITTTSGLPTISTSSPTSLPVPSTASIMTTAEETSKTSTTRATVPAVILSTTVSPPTTGIHTTTSTPRITSTNLSTTPITTTSVTSTPRIASTNLSTTPITTTSGLPTISTSSPTSLPVPLAASIMTTAEETSKTSTTRATVPAVILSTTVSPPTTGIHTTTSTPRITSTNLSTTPITTTSVTSTPRITSTNLPTTPITTTSTTTVHTSTTTAAAMTTTPSTVQTTEPILSAALFEYGTQVNDQKLTITGTDVTSPVFKPEIDFPFGNSRLSLLYFTDNGLIVFPSSETEIFTYTNPPAKSPAFPDVSLPPVVAVFWSDADLSKNVGTIFYQEYKTYGDEFSNLTHQVETTINKVNGRKYKAKWTLKITWEKVPAFTAAGTQKQTNTYQAVVTTDGKTSFVVMKYLSGGMNWDVSTLVSDKVVIGFDSGNGIYKNEEDRQPAAENFRPDKYPGTNTGLNGLRLYKLINTAPPENYKANCLSWFASQPDASKWNRGLLPCPCSFPQGQADNRYQTSSSDASTMALRSTSQNAFGAGQRCIYTKRNALIEGWQERIWNSNLNQDSDLDPYRWCCKEVDDPSFCEYYRTKRPSINCRNYRPPTRAMMLGDPHFTTLDGLSFTFNGLGDFVLLNVNESNGNTIFKLHGRTVQTGAALATNFMAFAAQHTSDKNTTVEMILKGNDSIDVLLNNVTVKFLPSTEGNKEIYRIGTLYMEKNGNASITVSFGSGISLSVKAGYGMLLVITNLPEKYMNKTNGLLGVWNGNQTDDFTMPNGSVIPTNSKESTIFDYGKTWEVPWNSSIFTIERSTPNNSFTPRYLDDLKQQDQNKYNMLAMECKNNTRCIFDALSTGRKEIGLATEKENEQFEKDNRVLNSFPPTIQGPNVIYAELFQQVISYYTATRNNVTFIAHTSKDLNVTDNGTLTWHPKSINAITLEIEAVGSNNLTSVLTPRLVIFNCSENGTPINNETSRINGSSVYRAACKCDSQFTGSDCQFAINPCQGVRCFEGANCSSEGSCGACPTGLTGDGIHCSDINECENENLCPPNATCINAVRSYNCSCNAGFSGNGMFCTAIDPCDNSTCSPNATCQDTNGNITCSCKEGFTGNGTVCFPLPDSCDSVQCLSSFCNNRGNCKTNPADSCRRFCVCSSQYKGEQCTEAASQFIAQPLPTLPKRSVNITLRVENNSSSLDDLSLKSNTTKKVHEILTEVKYFFNDSDYVFWSKGERVTTAVVSLFNYNGNKTTIDFLNDDLHEAIRNAFNDRLTQRVVVNIKFDRLNEADIQDITKLSNNDLMNYFNCNNTEFAGYIARWDDQIGVICQSPCEMNYCLNQGICQHLLTGPLCKCVPRTVYFSSGDRCENISLNLGAFFGILFGALAFLLLLMLVIFFIVWKCKKSGREKLVNDSSSIEDIHTSFSIQNHPFSSKMKSTYILPSLGDKDLTPVGWKPNFDHVNPAAEMKIERPSFKRNGADSEIP